jgi:hypothetical protein
MREEIESKLATDLTHREEVECKQQLREIQDKLTLDVTTEIFFHQAKPLVEEFRSALNSTVRDSFVKKPRAAPSSARKMELIDEYILRLQSYPELASFLPLFSYHRNSDQCEDCGAELVDVDADSLLCDQCGREYPFYLQEGHREPTFKDLGRIEHERQVQLHPAERTSGTRSSSSRASRTSTSTPWSTTGSSDPSRRTS